MCVCCLCVCLLFVVCVCEQETELDQKKADRHSLLKACKVMCKLHHMHVGIRTYMYTCMYVSFQS